MEDSKKKIFLLVGVIKINKKKKICVCYYLLLICVKF